MNRPQHQEIDHRILKLMVGLVALTLASATSFFSDGVILSISQSHCHGGWARDFFVGTMFAIAAFMAAYNGFSRLEMWVTKVTAVSAVGVAWFPMECPGQPEIIPGAHVVSAIIMFASLAVLCRIFHSRARSHGLPRANRRAFIYAACGIAILGAMGLVAIDHLLGNPLKAAVPRLEIYSQQVALVAFGVAWLVASHVLPWVTSPEEQWVGRV
jgi:hypothetical protein